MALKFKFCGAGLGFPFGTAISFLKALPYSSEERGEQHMVWKWEWKFFDWCSFFLFSTTIAGEAVGKAALF